MSADDRESWEETIDILSDPEVAEALREGIAEARAGQFADSEAIKAKYGRAAILEEIEEHGPILADAEDQAWVRAVLADAGLADPDST